jgi:RimJ/RimL family protein N-acetyltransferase
MLPARQIGISLPIFWTPRLVLRPRKLEDIDSLLDLHQDPLVMRFSKSGPIFDRAEHRRKLEAKIRRSQTPGFGYWSIFLSDQPAQFVGSVMLIPFCEISCEVEAGWQVVASRWGQGLGSEAIAAVLTHGFMAFGARAICALIDPRNERSLCVAKRFGFHPDAAVRYGTHRRYCLSQAAFEACIGPYATQRRRRGTAQSER